MLFRILLITFLTLFQSNSFGDPFTNQIGIIEEPKVVEIVVEEAKEPEPDLIVENENVEENTSIELTNETEEIVEVVKS